MSGRRTLLGTLTVTTLLLVGLLVLVPGEAQAAQITGLTVSGIQNPNGSAVADGDETFLVTVDVAIPDGEHIPLDYARVLVAPATSSLSGGVLGGALCDTDVSSGASATITAVAGATRVQADFTGYGYGIDDSGDAGYGYGFGYGFSHTSPSETFSGYNGGYGYGYGYGTSGATATVTISVSGCFGHISSAFNADGYEHFRIQTFVGGDAAHSIPSFPASVVLADPFAAGTGTLVADPSGITVTGGTIPAGTTTTVPLTGGITQQVQITNLQDLTPGSRILLLQQESVDRSAPSFGVPSLHAQFPGAAPALQFQVELHEADGDVVTALTGVLTLRMDLRIDPAYFAALPAGLGTNNFKVFAYDDNGALKPSGQQPRTTFLTAEPDHTFRVTITHFSSFAGGSTTTSLVTGGSGSGGGGGGGPATDVPTDETPEVPDPVDEPTTPVTPEEPAEPAEEPVLEEPEKESKRGIPAGSPFLALAGLLAAALVLRRSR